MGGSGSVSYLLLLLLPAATAAVPVDLGRVSVRSVVPAVPVVLLHRGEAAALLLQLTAALLLL